MKYHEQIKQLYQLKKEVEKSDNQILVGQINEIIKKIHQEQTVISFIGHFSSGKSSLINHIFNEAMLPSSPVPTTSNTAQIIISRQNNVRINLDNHTYSDLNHYEDIKKVNTLNHNIESVEIYKPSERFDTGTVIQDTPGIDATFKNHEASTMKFLLISDVVFYTVEYNHVNSEKNFEQIRALNQLKVPVVLIINQIDKHQESELGFDAFKAAIEENLTRWQLNVEHILFTSIYQCPNNEVERLIPLMKDYLTHAQNEKDAYFNRMVNYIESTQIDYLNNVKMRLLDELNLEEDEVEQAFDRATSQAAMNAEQAVLTDDNNDQLLLNAVKDILKNAYIMPFEMREKNKALLETFADNYKVSGLFGKKAKRIAIQQEKLDEVVNAMNDIIEKQITFQLKAYYDRFAKYLTDASMINAIQFKLTADDIRSLIKSQPVITNDYVLIFSDEIKNDVERMIIDTQKKWHTQFIKNINMSNLNTNDTVNEETVKFDAYFVNESLLQSITTKNYLHYYIHVDESVDKLIDRSFVTFELHDEVPTSDHQVQSTNTENTIVNLDRANDILEGLSAIDYFKADIEKIRTHIDRLNQNITKIVVFGAFSAGKSAMINALLKEEILISSPNPTTASITEIQYGSHNYVTFKKEETLLTALNDMMSTNSKEVSSLQQWIQRYKGNLQQLSAQDRNFAEAVIAHYELYADYIAQGSTIEVSKADIKKYTAEDSHAAFVQKITLGIQNEFLKDKVIIDSPGTGSTNSRHTKETTEIIADSDLLIYVSYYNHVFTEKDKAFLKLLNEVEVINEDSKNFFVINAIDLAKDEAELNTVVNYLASELTALNIHDPVYPVSSRNALKAYDSYFKKFKNDIDDFVTHTSKQQKMKQINHQTDILHQKAISLEQDFSAYREQIKKRNQQYDTWKNDGPINKTIVHDVKRNVVDQVNEQTTYLKDKMKIQLYDILKNEINTSSDETHMKQNYLKAVQHKLNDELYLITPRLNKGVQSSYQQKIALLIPTLEQNEIFEDIQYKGQLFQTDDINIHALTEDLQNVSLPNIKQKQLLQQASRAQLYDEIHATTIDVIKQMIDVYKNEMMQFLDVKIGDLTEYIDKKNKLMQQTMLEKQKIEIDQSMMQSVETALKNIEVK